MTERFRAVRVVNAEDSQSIAVLDIETEKIARFTPEEENDRLEDVIHSMRAGGGMAWVWDRVEEFEIEEFDA